jgi:hypothetical protein
MVEEMSKPKRYDIICPECQREFQVAKSLAHLTGVYNFGRARCAGCETTLNVTYLPEQDVMKVRRYDEFLSEINPEDEGGKGDRMNVTG